MSAHSIPDDGFPHSLSTECGCGVYRVWTVFGGQTRFVFEHTDGRLCNEVNPATGGRCANDAGCVGPHRHTWPGADGGFTEWTSRADDAGSPTRTGPAPVPP